MGAENTLRIPDDEIDLKSIGGKVFSFFAYPLSLLFSNILTASCFVLAAIVLSIAFKYLTPKTYTSSFIIRPTDIKDKTYLKVLSDIPLLLKNSDKHALTSLLEIDSSTVDKLVKITITHLAIKNAIDSSNVTEIELESRDTRAMLPVQNSILRYLENNPYYLRIKNLQKEQIDLNLAQINKDLIQLDSLKKIQLDQYEKQKISLQNTVMLNDLINPTAAYTASSERMIKKTNLLAQTVFLDRFLLIKGCVISSRHSWPPRILVLCLFTVPISLLLCVCVLHYRSKRR